jgi:hypothetical protein
LKIIRAEKGHLDDETLQELNILDARTKERLLRIINLKRETEAAHTTRYAILLGVKSFTSSSKYFRTTVLIKLPLLYELIQNADDSSYSKVCSDKVPPYLRFKVTRDTLIVETNQDGFTRANIEAICATGKRSKKMTDTDDQIGKKGFDFKSVFSVAEEVQVQSGLWSFFFRHRKGEDGLEMVTPLDAVPDVLPADVTTRITLRYSEEAKQEYARLLEALLDLLDTTILFLQRLRSIHVEVVQ